ncbi:uncharacterized protein LOC143916521 [Arctopsyche grandis]|uniref:uncharacterized protein LOC143916521 n=1 Tax=Arctopsyche grandis TaxID=121162 RepID=UPI00406D7D63
MNDFKCLVILSMFTIFAFVYSDTDFSKNQNVIALVPIFPNNICAVQLYHQLNDSWTILAKINLNATDSYSAIVSDGMLLILGGIKRPNQYVDEVVSFNLATKEISKLKPMGQKKGNLGVGKIGEYLYITGGIGISDKVYDTVERYDRKADRWTVMASMLTTRYHHAVNVWKGKMYVAGGIEGKKYDVLNSLEIYDPHLNRWSLGTPMKLERYGLSIVFLDGSLFAIGGNWTLDNPQGERMDLDSQNWTDINNTIKLTTWIKAVALDDKLIISGNEDHNYDYSPKTKELRQISPNDPTSPNLLLVLTR